MKPIQKIMVPLAFSSISKDILQYAAELATALNADLLLVNVINERDIEAVQVISSFGYKIDEEHYVEEVKKQRIDLLEEMVSELDFPEEHLHFVLKLGKPAKVLLKVAAQEKVDMIVMGVKAQSELIHAFTGSVADKLFHRSPITIVSYRDEHTAAKLLKKEKG